MQLSTLINRSLRYYWRSNIAVVLGVATAVAVLAGALLVGDSVRGSLRDLFMNRLGKTDLVVVSTNFFREKLADEIQADSQFSGLFSNTTPVIVLSGLVTDQTTGRRASRVQVYGVDSRFFRFHNVDVQPPDDREVMMSPDLARELGTAAGQAALLRIEKPSAIPAGSLHGRKEDLARTMRLIAREPLPEDRLGEFSLRAEQGPVRAVFVSLARLQKEVEQPGEVNTLLVAGAASDGNRATADASGLTRILKDNFSLEDLGIKLRVLDRQRGIALESKSAIINDALFAEAAEAADKANLTVVPILSYLANGIRRGDREVPYSVVTAIDSDAFASMTSRFAQHRAVESPSPTSSLPPIILSEWAATDLGAKPGDSISLEYYLWEDAGQLRTENARFVLEAIAPLDETLDRDLVPEYPGLTETENMSDWDPPFPVDLKKVRPKDEDYWHKYRTASKAFVQLETGVKLWQSRHGKYTSLRLRPKEGSAPDAAFGTLKERLRTSLDPAVMGLTIQPVRSEGLQASRGATDFGEYFVYFSFFLVAGALLLASLFFKLGIEQRLREIGTMRAVGFAAADVRRLFLREGLLLAATGSIIGVIGAVGYAWLMMYGLRNWWVGAVGTTMLSLHIAPISLALGGAGGIVAALLCIVWTLKGLAQSSPRNLLSGSLDAVRSKGSRRMPSSMLIAMTFGIGALLLLAAASLSLIGKTGGFFGAGTMLLIASFGFGHAWLTRTSRNAIHGRGWWPISRLGFRNAAYRPGRSILCISLIASAAFIIVAVDAFKRETSETTIDRKSGTGGFPLIAESLLPLYHDPNTEEGQEQLSLGSKEGFDLDRVRFERFRVRPGDDASCLNLYEPRDPRILGVDDEFIREGRFSFQDSTARTPEEQNNPWLLLNSELPDGAIPVIADANSMSYVLHRKLGDEILIAGSNGKPARLRFVAALSDSIFQSELLISESHFLALFHDQGGFSLFLLDVAPESTTTVSSALEDQLSDFGFDVVSTTERLASFHRVENTYLSTFQTLGGLGLVLGTLGLATVLLRNVLERRRELALLRAVGYNSGHFAFMVIVENALLVFGGLVVGAVSALIAIGPAFLSRGGQIPALSFGLLAVVLVIGLSSSVAATIAALRMPLLASLRSE